MKRAKNLNRPKISGKLAASRVAWPWAVGLLLLVTAVYWPTLANGFVWDDGTNVIDNSTLRSLDGLRQMWFVPRTTQQYYPLMYTSHWVEYQLWGLAPLGYHLVNLLLAAVAAVLVWRVLARLGVPGAWLAAALFAVHPAISLREKLAEDHPENGTYQNDLATTYMDLGFLQRGARRQADAAGSFQSAIEIRKKLSKVHLANEWANNLAGSLMILGQLQLEMARPDEADRSLWQAILIREKLVRDVPAVANYRADLASTYISRGAALIADGHADGAVAACQRAVEILETLVRECPESADYQDRLAAGYTTLGTVQAAMGRSADAEVSVGQAAEIRAKLVPKNRMPEGRGTSEC